MIHTDENDFLMILQAVIGLILIVAMGVGITLLSRLPWDRMEKEISGHGLKYYVDRVWVGTNK